MSSVKITLSFAFSYYSNGLVKYQCPSWPELGGITRFDSISYGEDKIKYFLQENIKATLGFTDSPFFMSPETLWRRQMNCTRYDETKLEVPVNANPRKNFNQDQTPFCITVGQVQAESPHLSASEKSPPDDKFYNLIILNFLILFVFKKRIF